MLCFVCRPVHPSGHTQPPRLNPIHNNQHRFLPLKNQQVEVDIRCDPPDTAAVGFLRRLSASHPAFIPVATALKLLLHQGGMDKVGR